jgi:hypothetical protein
MASIAILALNAGEWFRRGLLLICSALVVSGSILARRSSQSTLGRVQICAAGSGEKRDLTLRSLVTLRSLRDPALAALDVTLRSMTLRSLATV